MGALETIDIHGMTKEQAKVAIDAKLKQCKGSAYRLTVIHGYHGGTVLRDFVRSSYKKNGKVLRIEIGLNPGETELVLREF